uniref:ABC transmembrane type-1 domain-containing protein n=1 Tax=Anopheles maculatus TaxID=74869 RepID=A0A182S5M8_9DIPT
MEAHGGSCELDGGAWCFVTKSTRASLWRCYVRNGWRMFLLGGLLKLAGDLCALVGPLCISNIVDYIAAQSMVAGVGETSAASLISSNETARWQGPTGFTDFGKSNQSPAATAGDLDENGDGTNGARPVEGLETLALTWASLFANGWIVCVLVLVASLAQGTLSQASTHLMDEEGIRLKNALQGLVYRKTLLLSSSCFHAVEKLPARTDGPAPGPVVDRPQQSKPRRQSVENGERHRRESPSVENNVNRRAAAATELDTEVIEHKTSVANSAPGDGVGSDERRPTPNATPTNVNRVHQFSDRRSNWEGNAAERLICDAQPGEVPATNEPPSAAETASERGRNGPNFAHDAGTITNLMSDDAFNVMSFVKMVHYVWAIPLKLSVAVSLAQL